MRLHLGCGEQYLPGYVNIDYPLSEHTVQTTSVADQYADLLQLRYPARAIEEVRLHHVFEHFTRPVACALLTSWYSWLRLGGRLHIEVPNFQRTARLLLNRLAPRKLRTRAERHLFGSHEAAWAIHCAGYMPDTLSYLVEQYGFTVESVGRSHYHRGVHQLTVIAQKAKPDLTRQDLRRATQALMRNSLVDSSESELRLLSVWLGIYERQVDASWCSDE